MKKGQIAEGIVERVEFPNRGIVNTGDAKVMVKGVLPGQRIQFAVTRAGKGRCEGKLKAVLEASGLETEIPACPHFGDCGGCAYQRLSYENQLALKEEQVRRLLDAACEKEYEFEGILRSPQCWEYRNKMEFSFGDAFKGGPLALGMHKKGSFYDIVTTDQCRIVHPDFDRILAATLELFADAGIPFYHKMSHEGYLRHLLVRRAARTGELLVALVTAGEKGAAALGRDPGAAALWPGWIGKWKERLLALPLEGKFAGILHLENGREADVVQADAVHVLYGQDYFTEELLGLKFQISTFSFFQTNSLGAEVLYGKAREYVGETAGRVIFDLYSGTGTIAQMLAPVAEKVVGVELVEEAVEAARENARRNGLGNVEFLAGDVLKKLDEIEEKPDLIVLDPPRDGVNPKALKKILAYQVERIVYISCKPTSLARDLVLLQDAGYRLEKAACVDMFAWTPNVETIVLLSHKSPDSHINVKVEFGEGEGKVPLDAIAERAKKYQPKPKITYKMIQEYVEKKYGFKVHTAYIAEVKRSLGLTMYDTPNAVEELKNPRMHPPKEKVEAITDALKYFKVI